MAISGAAGQIGYALIPLVCSGKMFGEDQPIELNLLDIAPVMEALNGVVMEIEDCAYPLVKGVIATDNYEVAFENVKWVVLIGGFPRKDGMTRGDLLGKNGPIFIGQGKALKEKADKDVRVLVVANPANTNAYVLAANAVSEGGIQKKNITALTRLDMNRARNMVAAKLGQPVEEVKNITIFGNHSKTQFPYAGAATCKNGESVVQAIADDAAFLDGDFISLVQQRGAAVIKARGLSSAMSAASAIKDHMHDWYFGTKPGEYVSMAVCSEGDDPQTGNGYGIDNDLVYSFPVSIENQEWKIKKGFELTAKQTKLLKATEKELMDERENVKDYLPTSKM